MDGRWKQWIAGGLFAGVLGCSTTPKQPDYPGSPPPPQVVHKNSIVVAEPPDVRSNKDGPVAIQTLIVFADTWLEVGVRPAHSGGKRARDLSDLVFEHRVHHERPPDPPQPGVSLARCLDRFQAFSTPEQNSVAVGAHADIAGPLQLVE